MMDRLEWLPEKYEFQFTRQQRQWYRRVYTDRCGFPVFNEERGRYLRCFNTRELQVHHIVPNAWTNEQHPDRDPNSLLTTYGILLCTFHHHEIHPDIKHAVKHYYEDKDGIKNAVLDHQDLARRGIKFWNDEYDQLLWNTAERMVMRYLDEHPEDRYPEDTKWMPKKGIIYAH